MFLRRPFCCRSPTARCATRHTIVAIWIAGTGASPSPGPRNTATLRDGSRSAQANQSRAQAAIHTRSITRCCVSGRNTHLYRIGATSRRAPKSRRGERDSERGRIGSGHGRFYGPMRPVVLIAIRSRLIWPVVVFPWLSVAIHSIIPSGAPSARIPAYNRPPCQYARLQ